MYFAKIIRNSLLLFSVLFSQIQFVAKKFMENPSSKCNKIILTYNYLLLFGPEFLEQLRAKPTVNNVRDQKRSFLKLIRECKSYNNLFALLNKDYEKMIFYNNFIQVLCICWEEILYSPIDLNDLENKITILLGFQVKINQLATLDEEISLDKKQLVELMKIYRTKCFVFLELKKNKHPDITQELKEVVKEELPKTENHPRNIINLLTLESFVFFLDNLNCDDIGKYSVGIIILITLKEAIKKNDHFWKDHIDFFISTDLSKAFALLKAFFCKTADITSEEREFKQIENYELYTEFFEKILQDNSLKWVFNDEKEIYNDVKKKSKLFIFYLKNKVNVLEKNSIDNPLLSKDCVLTEEVIEKNVEEFTSAGFTSRDFRK